MHSQHCFFIAAGWRANANREHVQALALELVRRGHQVVLIVDGRRDELVSPQSNPALYTWPSKRPTGFQDARFLGGLIRKYKPACLVAQFGAVNVMMGMGLLMGVPNRVAVHRTLSTQIDADSHLPPWQIKLLRLRKSIVFRWATHLIANSNSTRLDLERAYHVDPRMVFVVHNDLQDPIAHDTDLLGIPKVPNKVVCVGRLDRSKGQGTLIRAAQKLIDIPGFRIEFIGNGGQLENYRSLALELGVADICRFHGGVPHAQVFRHMASAALVVVPSLDEAFGYVCIEAMAVGTPVVASRAGGLQEIVREQEDGLLVQPGDVDALAEALRQCLSSPAELKRMGQNARQRFLDRFDMKYNVKSEADWLEQLIANGVA